MAIKEGDFVQISYTGRVDGDIFDTTEEEKAKEEGIYDESKSYDPITIRVGSMHVIPGLDEALVGKEIGEDYEMEIPAEKAYGPHDESLVRSAPVKDFREKPTLGTRVSSEGREGVVVNIVGKRAVVDFNHPLAGKDLQYSFRIEGVVEGSEEKAKALIKLFSGRDMDLTLEDGILTILLPPGINYDRRWMPGRGMIVHQIFEFIDDVNEIVMKETFKRPEKFEEIVEAVEEPEAEAAEEGIPEESEE
jgi:FKBP-type peptidyl-prolyl cis-trans isomerase SlyD